MLVASNTQSRLPELVSGSIRPLARTFAWRTTEPLEFREMAGDEAKWILKQVQDDESGKVGN